MCRRTSQYPVIIGYSAENKYSIRIVAIQTSREYLESEMTRKTCGTSVTRGDVLR